MPFRYSIKPIYKCIFLFAGALGFCIGIVCSIIGVYTLHLSIKYSILGIVFGLFFLFYSALFFSRLINRKLILDSNYLLLRFGIYYYSKIQYESISSIRYAKKEDYITKDNPYYGKLADTICIFYNTDDKVFISVQDVSEFYIALLRKVKEKTRKVV